MHGLQGGGQYVGIVVALVDGWGLLVEVEAGRCTEPVLFWSVVPEETSERGDLPR